jgi:hypothetical protein
MKKVRLLASLLLVICIFFAARAFAGTDGVYFATEETPMGKQKAIIALNADGTGYVTNMMGKTEFTGAKIEGNNFSFTMTGNTPRGKLKFDYIGTVNGDQISGTTKGPMGTTTFTGTRKK